MVRAGRLPALALLLVLLASPLRAAVPPPVVEVAHLAGARGAVTTMAFGPADDLLAFGSRDDLLHVWHVGSDVAPTAAEGGGSVMFVQRKAGGPWRLLAVGRKGTVNIYDPQTLKRDEWISQKGGIAAVSADTRTLVTADADVGQPLHLYRLGAEIPADTVSTLPRLQGLGGTVSSLATSADASTLVIAGTIAGGGAGIPPDGFVLFWNRRDNEMPRVEKMYSSILGLAVNADRTLVAAVGYEGDADMQTGRITVWDMVTRRLLVTLPPQPRGVAAAAFQPGSTLLATGGLDGQLRFWDGASGRMHGMVKISSAVTSLAFSRSGRQLAVGTEDGTVRVFDVSGLVVRPL